MGPPKWTLWLLWAVRIVALAGLFAAVAGGGARAPAKRRRATRVLRARRGLHPAPSPEPSFLVLPESRLTPGFVQVEQCPCGVRPDGTQAAGTEDHSDVSAAGVVMTPGRRSPPKSSRPTHVGRTVMRAMRVPGWSAMAR